MKISFFTFIMFVLLVQGDATQETERLANATEIAILANHSGGVWSIAFSPDGQILASGIIKHEQITDEGDIKLWDVQTGEEIRTLKGHLFGDPDFPPLLMGGTCGL